ncbi:MAG: serine/threonine-protein kinase [Actinomycetota bacterium]
MAARYRIIKEIGRGAMGRVYLAHDNLLERQVALKELVAPGYLSEDEREEIRERFRLEAKAAARLTHPYVMTVHDIVVSGDRQFIVMEYLEGKTLREVLAERVFSAEEVLSIAPMISDALDYAHSNGIVHRDVKPDNIFVI